MKYGIKLDGVNILDLKKFRDDLEEGFLQITWVQYRDVFTGIIRDKNGTFENGEFVSSIKYGIRVDAQNKIRGVSRFKTGGVPGSHQEMTKEHYIKTSDKMLADHGNGFYIDGQYVNETEEAKVERNAAWEILIAQKATDAEKKKLSELAARLRILGVTGTNMDQY